MTKPLLEVVAGIVWRGGEYLAVQRPEGARMAGWWEFPGGKIEPGESREAALVREFREELDVTPLTFEYWRDLVHEYDEFVVRLHFFHIRSYSGELKGVEGQSMVWVDPNGPVSLDFLPADIAIVEALHS
ncbi:MAG: (deoxy)nucleoside triphosphate pyrophosphohydrolase [Pseudodesulfovibrio sp.]|uniref:8-oxo-dGTP diphosphatase n=1 Tax=Pseudodesulfovibrio indicus TaxID=1716143 RepID=A0A126QP40_9BACT|nr:(deoxy)nucleoside triphosphate pyrophosphohydrolase [Pseudodesulfovibrio indicus]AMK11569.1 DNA mismatch repair protein MutT [Pseudodesulfovibrio indicus]TDT89975.1 8-oxo-dGTP diphosphatase [Pseudodesulfovibrio indicus]